MSRSDLKDLGEALDAGRAGLIAVYEFDLADQVAAIIKAANRVVSRETDMAADQLAADLARADAGKTDDVPVPRQPTGSSDTAVTMTAIGD
jgi:hypothetical protein